MDCPRDLPFRESDHKSRLGPRLLGPLEDGIFFPAVFDDMMDILPAKTELGDNGRQLFLDSITLLPSDSRHYHGDNSRFIQSIDEEKQLKKPTIFVVSSLHSFVEPVLIRDKVENARFQRGVDALKARFPNTLVRNVDDEIIQSEEIYRGSRQGAASAGMEAASVAGMAASAGMAAGSECQFNMKITESDPRRFPNLSYYADTLFRVGFTDEEISNALLSLVREYHPLETSIEFLNVSIDSMCRRKLDEARSFIRDKNVKGVSERDFTDEQKDFLANVQANILVRNYWQERPLLPLNESFCLIKSQDRHRLKDVTDIFNKDPKDLPGVDQLTVGVLFPRVEGDPRPVEYMDKDGNIIPDYVYGGDIFRFAFDFNYIIEQLKIIGRQHFKTSFYYSVPDMCELLASKDFLDHVAGEISKLTGSDFTFEEPPPINMFDDGCKNALFVKDPDTGLSYNLDLVQMGSHGDLEAYKRASETGHISSDEAAAAVGVAGVAVAAVLRMNDRHYTQFTFNCEVPLFWTHLLVPMFATGEIHSLPPEYLSIGNGTPADFDDTPRHFVNDAATKVMRDEDQSLGDAYLSDEEFQRVYTAHINADLDNIASRLFGRENTQHKQNHPVEKSFVTLASNPDFPMGEADSRQASIAAWARSGDVNPQGAEAGAGAPVDNGTTRVTRSSTRVPHVSHRVDGPYQKKPGKKTGGDGRGGSSKKKRKSILTRRPRRSRNAVRSRKGLRSRRSRK